MPLRVGINGVGRIGRALVRHIVPREDIHLVAANDLLPPDAMARLLARDSVYGPALFRVRATEGGLIAGNRRIRLTGTTNPAEIPWPEESVEMVFEATGKFTRRAEAALHLRGTVNRVIVTATAPDADMTLLAGINDAAFAPDRHHIVSAGSCTAQCLGPVLAVLGERFGIVSASMTTIHPYTAHQPLLDGWGGAASDPRRGRAAGLSMIPTTTTALGAVESVFPALRGRLTGLAVRVPTPAVSLLELVATLERPADEVSLRQAFLDAEAGPLAGILGTATDEPVSVDLLGDDRAAVVDLPLTVCVAERLVRVVAWYDNEWAYAGRLVATALSLARGSNGAAAVSRAARPRETGA